jgi:hypothetical protein
MAYIVNVSSAVGSLTMGLHSSSTTSTSTSCSCLTSATSVQVKAATTRMWSFTVIACPSDAQVWGVIIVTALGEGNTAAASSSLHELMLAWSVAVRACLYDLRFGNEVGICHSFLRLTGLAHVGEASTWR